MRTNASHIAAVALLLAAFSALAQPPSNAPLGVTGSDRAPITVLIFSNFEFFPCGRSTGVLRKCAKIT
jgi:hypothetical protein